MGCNCTKTRVYARSAAPTPNGSPNDIALGVVPGMQYVVLTPDGRKLTFLTYQEAYNAYISAGGGSISQEVIQNA